MNEYDDGATTSWASPEQLCAILYVRAYREGDGETVARIRSIWDALRESSKAPKDDRPTLWGAPVEIVPAANDSTPETPAATFGDFEDGVRMHMRMLRQHRGNSEGNDNEAP